MFARTSFLLVSVMFTMLGAGPALAQAGSGARIVGIQATTDVVVVESGFKNLESRRLPKFAPVGRTIPRAVLLVDWQTTGAISAGAVVRFRYRRPGSDELRVIDQVLEQAVTGRQRAKFAVSLYEPARDRVAAWQVQLLHNGVVLDEQHSAAWK